MSQPGLTLETRDEQRLVERALLRAAHEKESAVTHAHLDVERKKLLADAHTLRALAAKIQL